MTEAGFYHLTRSSVLDALPKLLGRTLDAGQRALVLCGGAVLLNDVSTALWSSSSPDWLPHGGAGRGADRPEWQPIWLATTLDGAAPNGARYLFLVGGAAPRPGFERIFDLFDGNSDQELGLARQRWLDSKAAGDRLTYWQQGERGWVAKARG